MAAAFPFHWWRTVFYLIPAIAHTIVLGAASILSSPFRSATFCHRCKRLVALILKTTGVSPSRAPSAGISDAVTVAKSSVTTMTRWSSSALAACAADHREGVARQVSVLGWYLKRSGHLFGSKEPDRAGISKRCALVSDGPSLIIYAETRSPDGRVARFAGFRWRQPAACRRGDGRTAVH
jgi:hypothetical protein